MNPKYDENCIREFADEIDRDPGIVLGRLLIENKKKSVVVLFADKDQP